MNSNLNIFPLLFGIVIDFSLMKVTARWHRPLPGLKQNSVMGTGQEISLYSCRGTDVKSSQIGVELLFHYLKNNKKNLKKNA